MTFGFQVQARLEQGLGRTGVISTPHGQIRTPAFIVVGTKATVKAMLPQTVAELGAQAVLANAYHLFLQPGPEIVDQAGGLGRFMNWEGPTFTDSGGFQVMSLGVGFKKVLAMDTRGLTSDDVVAENAARLVQVDDDGVTFTSHLNGARHRFTPEISMQIQHQLGADIMFAFDELTTLMNTRGYQEQSVQRTQAWAQRCLAEHRRLTQQRADHPYQALFGVVQGAQYEDLRRAAARGLAGLEAEGQHFDGYGIGGALEKERLGEICSWVSQSLPEDRPRHLLGISEPEDLFAGVAAGADTFDCVNPSRGPATAPSTPPAAATTSPPPPTGAALSRWNRAAAATPAATTAGPTCTTFSRPRSFWPRPWPPSTTNGLRSTWWTRSETRSTPATSPPSEPNGWAVTAPAGSDRSQPC